MGGIAHAGIPSLRDDNLAELLERGSARERGLEARPRLRQPAGRSAQYKHFCAKPQRELAQIGGTAVAERRNGFLHLIRIAARLAERRVHVGEECDDGACVARAQRNHRLREANAVGDIRKKCPGTGFDIEHQPGERLRELLAHDTRGDQRNRFDRRGGIAHGVEFLVGRGDFSGLADQGAPEPLDLRGGTVQSEPCVETGDRLEFVEGAAGVPEAAARHHRHRHAAGGDQRGEHNRDFVAHPARGMLVDPPHREVAQVERSSASEHPLHERDGFVVVEPAKENGHQERGNLIIRCLTGGNIAGERAPFLVGNAPAVAFAFNKIAQRH